MKNNKYISIENLKFRYSGQNDFRLNIENCEIVRDNILGIYGLAGSGKTTLGKLIAGMLTPESGSVFYRENGIDSSISGKNIIYSMQFPENIFLGITIYETVEKLVKNHEKGSEIEIDLQTYLKFFDVDYDLIKKRNGYELSSGELRRFALCLSLACSPDLLILDEPTIALGQKGKRQLQNLILDLTKKQQVVIISHDFELLRECCDYFWIIDNGEIVFKGKIPQIRNNIELLKRTGLIYYF